MNSISPEAPATDAYPLIIVGLDGATFDVLDPLMAAGELPNLRRLCEGGLRTELRSTMPPATMPAWTSFLTGAEPGEHGVTDMFVHDGDYTLRPASGSMRTEPTFLARLSARGMRVASLGVPGTWPPEPIDGLIVAGFDTPGAHRASPSGVWPRRFHDEIERFGGWQYATFNEQSRGDKRITAAVDALLDDIERKERLILHTWRKEPWDAFMVHLQASDTAGHHLWHTWDAKSPRCSGATHDGLQRIYRRLDTVIGRLLAAAPENARVLVVSDHGMGGASDVAVHLNRWLAERGLLYFHEGQQNVARDTVGRSLRAALGALPTSAVGALARHTPAAVAGSLLGLTRGVAADFRHSAAFSDELDYAPSIWLNRRGVFPHGKLDEQHADRLAEQIRGELLELRDPRTQAPLIAAVHHRRDAVPGKYCNRAPDLLIEPAWPQGYRPAFLPSHGPGPVVRHLTGDELAAPRGSGMPGVHRREGVFIAHGPGLPAMDLPSLDIAQAGALIYPLMDMAIPRDVKTELPAWLEEILPIARAQNEDEKVLDATQAQIPPPHITESEWPVLQRLRSLGYIE